MHVSKIKINRLVSICSTCFAFVSSRVVRDSVQLNVGVEGEVVTAVTYRGGEKGGHEKEEKRAPDRAHSIDIDGRIDHQDRHTRGFVTEFWNLGLSNRSRTHKPSAIGYIQPAASGLRCGRRHADRFDRSRPRIDRTWSHLRQPWNLDDKKNEMAWVGSKSGWEVVCRSPCPLSGGSREAACLPGSWREA